MCTIGKNTSWESWLGQCVLKDHHDCWIAQERFLPCCTPCTTIGLHFARLEYIRIPLKTVLLECYISWFSMANVLCLVLFSSTTDLQRVFGENSDEEVCYPPVHHHGNEFYLVLTMCRTLFHMHGVSEISALQERRVTRPRPNG